MNKKTFESHMDVILTLGSIWGLSEAILGMWLQRCASVYSGAIMTGLAFFYMAFAWTATRKILSLVLLLIVVSLFKILDALLLSVPFLSGSVVNPMFAFFTETLAFLVIIALVKKSFHERWTTRLLTGAGTAVVATFLFPLAGVFTGVPACLFPSTQVPQSIVTSPVAIIIALVTVPLGFILAEKYTSATTVIGNNRIGLILRYSLAPLVFVLCVVLVALNRIL
jgi:hypothetical protein